MWISYKVLNVTHRYKPMAVYSHCDKAGGKSNKRFVKLFHRYRIWRYIYVNYIHLFVTDKTNGCLFCWLQTTINQRAIVRNLAVVCSNCDKNEIECWLINALSICAGISPFFIVYICQISLNFFVQIIDQSTGCQRATVAICLLTWKHIESKL